MRALYPVCFSARQSAPRTTLLGEHKYGRARSPHPLGGADRALGCRPPVAADRGTSRGGGEAHTTPHPRPPARPPPPPRTVPPPPPAAGLVNINPATAPELELLPGIGPSLAQGIVAYREAHGLFREIEDLLDVPGIGPAKLEQIRGLVTGGEEGARPGGRGAGGAPPERPPG